MTDDEIAAINWEDETTLARLKTTYDQFVWIPVENINDLYMCKYGSKDCNITVQNINGKDVAYCTKHNSTLMGGRILSYGVANEPISALLYDYDHCYFVDNIFNAILDDHKPILNLSELINYFQAEYNSIVKSVYENKGFYIGRYRTSNVTSTNGTTAKFIDGTDKYKTRNNWYNMYTQQVDYANNKNLTTIGSTMVQGAAYEKVIQFVNQGNYNIAINELEDDIWTISGNNEQRRIGRVNRYYNRKTKMANYYIDDPMKKNNSFIQLYIKDNLEQLEVLNETDDIYIRLCLESDLGADELVIKCSKEDNLRDALRKNIINSNDIITCIMDLNDLEGFSFSDSEFTEEGPGVFRINEYCRLILNGAITFQEDEEGNLCETELPQECWGGALVLDHNEYYFYCEIDYEQYDLEMNQE